MITAHAIVAKKNESSECSLDCSESDESHRSSNEFVSERFPRLDFTLFHLWQKNALFETLSCTRYS